MYSKTFGKELRKMISALENKREIIEKELEAAQIVLAMVERETTNGTNTLGDRTYTNVVGDSIRDVLSAYPELHRKDILKALLERNVHIGNEGNSEKQLSGLSAVLSRDIRFKPVEGRAGYWTLVTTKDHDAPEPNEDADDVPKKSNQDFIPNPANRKGVRPFTVRQPNDIRDTLNDATQKDRAF